MPHTNTRTLIHTEYPDGGREEQVDCHCPRRASWKISLGHATAKLLPAEPAVLVMLRYATTKLSPAVATVLVVLRDWKH